MKGLCKVCYFPFRIDRLSSKRMSFVFFSGFPNRPLVNSMIPQKSDVGISVFRFNFCKMSQMIFILNKQYEIFPMSTVDFQGDFCHRFPPWLGQEAFKSIFQQNSSAGGKLFQLGFFFQIFQAVINFIDLAKWFQIFSGSSLRFP